MGILNKGANKWVMSDYFYMGGMFISLGIRKCLRNDLNNVFDV